MAKTLVARGQATINIQKDGYTITQSLGEYVFPADQNGKILTAISVTSTILVTQADSKFTNFTIGTVTKPTGFSAVTVDNSKKSVTFAVAANTTTLADHGSIDIPIVISGTTYHLTFVWSKAKKGATGNPGADANLLDWVKEWNTGKTLINSNTVITPKLFAGAKNSDGTISGIAIGNFALSTKTSSGIITTETVNGIYGFKNGYKTFFVDNGGNVQLGNGDQYIKYNPTTGKVEFGAGVSLNWVGATYINKDGIFTGTLSANTVKAIDIDASQITSGTIAAKYINTAELKSTLITAANINALTLTTTKGTIGGWSVDSDSIYRGTKKNTANTYTAASGSITIGSTGIRGYKWRLDSNGAGAIAGGNISWDASGNVTFASSVSLQWKNDIEAAKKTNLGYTYYQKIIINGNENTYYPVVLKGGEQTMKRDILIRRGYSEQAPTTWNTSTHKGGLILHLRANFGSWGGISYSWDIYDLSELYCRMFAGAKLCGNSCMFAIFLRGGGETGAVYHIYSDQPIVSSSWSPDPIPSAPQIAYEEDLIFKSGTYESYAPAPRTLTAAVEEEIRRHRFIVLAQSMDTTLAAHPLTYIGSTGIYTGTLTAAQVNAVNINASSILSGSLSADRIAAGSINASKLDSASIKSDIINTTYINGLSCTFTKGTIGGWTIASSKISNSQISLDAANKRVVVYGSGGSPTSGHRVQLYYNSNTDFGFWATDSAGTCIAALGSTNKIAGWLITASAISKGNVSLGSDGSITNGTKWKLNNDGSGRIASGNISWDAAGNVIFADSVSLEWTAPIEGIYSELDDYVYPGIADLDDALSDDVYPKLTKITAAGIYTGSITASQITAGTISADRIAAGSITSAKLDAASIKSNIINTSYINGLSCTFTKGKIGGFSIGSDNMTVGSVGAAGATPLQIRSVSVGSGYWYTGAYKPLGVTLTWHQSSNAGHVVFGQIAASGSTVKTGFIGIQMMSWDGCEYFCLSANYTKSGGKEVYNRIAGWAFDHNHIWKNNISLSSDGSITNGSKWKLNNDGSGQVASGNISWNASGTVTFGATVKTQWTTGITTAQELASAMAFGKMLYRDPTFFNGKNSTGIYNNTSNGNVTVTRVQDATAPNDSKYVLQIKTSGTASPKNGGFYFATMCSARKVLVCRIIAKIPAGRNIVWASNSIGTGGSSRWLTDNAGTGDWKEYIYKVVCGTENFSSTHFYYIDGTQGTAEEPLVWYVAYATVFDLTSTEKYTTTIDANGVYTGTVKAGQVIVDSALVVGGSTYDGSISVRNASNTAVVTLNRSGITATAGKIGGWTIASSTLTASAPSSGHRIVIANTGYIYHDNPSTGKDYWGLKTDGSAVFSQGMVSFKSDGSGFVANGNISWDASGNITAQNGTFKNVEIIGTVRNAFILNDSAIYIGGTDPQMNLNKYDHVVAVRGSWDENIPLPWTLEHSGRRVCLVNYKWGSNTTTGYMSITAPSGKYFFEDGISKSTITFSRELIELLGYGDNTTFFGWIVVNRLDIMTTKKYGSCMKYLAQGRVTCSSTSSVSVKYRTFDGSTITVSRLGKGQYRVYMSSSWNMSGYFNVFVTGIYSTVESTPIYATLKSMSSYYFDVYTADDNSLNDGSFNFLVVSTGDWT